MGAIGVRLQSLDPQTFDLGPWTLDLSVAIRTMVIHNNQAVFNVGGGIVTDSDPEAEYDESLLKAKALLEAMAVDLQDGSKNSRPG